MAFLRLTRASILIAVVLTLFTSSFAAPVKNQKLSAAKISGPLLVGYWGQNSNRHEGSLKSYCETGNYNVINIAFMHIFGAGAPGWNMAWHCTSDNNQDCHKFAEDIKFCQAKGVKIFISLGGAAGAYSLPTPESAKKVAQEIWDLFLGGNAPNRPFPGTRLDGVDFDIEGGTTQYWDLLVNELRSKGNVLISGAPQCPIPDYFLDRALRTSYFDIINVQFYNNYCGLTSYPTNFNYDQWDALARLNPNPNVLLTIGAPGSPSSASSGYVDPARLSTIATEMKSKFPAHFGGIMFWDVGTALDSGHAANAAKLLGVKA